MLTNNLPPKIAFQCEKLELALKQKIYLTPMKFPLLWVTLMIQRFEFVLMKRGFKIAVGIMVKR